MEEPDTRILDLGAGVSLEWLYGGRIAVFTVRLATRQGVDTWADHVIRTAQEWLPQHPYLVAHDVSGVALTPHGRQRALEISVANAGLKGRYALIIPPGPVGQDFMLFVNREFKIHDSREVEGQFFHNREAAIRWLAELL